MSMNRGQITIGVLATVAGLFAGVAAPILYVGDVKKDVAVQAAEISAIVDNINDLKSDNRDFAKKIDALLINRGIDPEKLLRTLP